MHAAWNAVIAQLLFSPGAISLDEIAYIMEA
jgi:hypothetical protein